jgi:hypothetical protein
MLDCAEARRRRSTDNGPWRIVRNNGLVEQERVHLSWALDLSPENPAILRRLGFRRLNGDWVTQAEWDAAARRAQTVRADLATWAPRMTEIRKGLESRSSRKRKASESKLEVIRDASAIPALERLAHQSENADELALKALAEISDHRAVLALARLAVTSESFTTQRVAAERLQDRNRDHFVPVMLASMHSPSNTRTLS